MKVLKWFWKKGECIGYLDKKGYEVKITLEMLQDIELHNLYHAEIRRKKEEQNGSNTESVRRDNALQG